MHIAAEYWPQFRKSPRGAKGAWEENLCWSVFCLESKQYILQESASDKTVTNGKHIKMPLKNTLESEIYRPLWFKCGRRRRRGAKHIATELPKWNLREVNDLLYDRETEKECAVSEIERVTVLCWRIKVREKKVGPSCVWKEEEEVGAYAPRTVEENLSHKMLQRDTRILGGG